MPIYAYQCTSCGHRQDVLQKLSDPLLTTCPACGAEAYAKQVTAAGFQLKGSGWYATDFKGGPTSKPKDEGGAGAEAPAKADGASDGKGDAKSDSKADAKPAASKEAKSDAGGASSKPAPAAAPSPGPAPAAGK